MDSLPSDHQARVRFRDDWRSNFAVSANAGSGKTTAISERLAAIAMSPEAAPRLARTAVVTFTKKAALQIAQRARAVLLKRLAGRSQEELAPLDHLERSFFGTIHSFCLLLAQRYGQTLGVNLNPVVISEDDDATWEAFLEQDCMEFTRITPEQLAAFLRHVPLETVFELARQLDRTTAERLLMRSPKGLPPAPDERVLDRILALTAKGMGKANLEASQRQAQAWARCCRDEKGFLKLYEPTGSAKALVELAAQWMAPLKVWLAQTGAVLASELASRYRVFRFERGVQTHVDQVDAALAVLQDRPTLERIRADGWSVILDEAQDTDPAQFSVLVEITRPPGSEPGIWPQGGGEGPLPGRFCMVGDGQQSIYGSRADIRNFSRHLQAFARGNGGELLEFHVTFRAPRSAITLLNAGFPEAFGQGREHNLGLPPQEGAPPPCLQVDYVPLEPGPANVEGRVSRIALLPPAVAPDSIDGWMAEEARQLAALLAAHGPRLFGVKTWGDVCVLAPRNDWLLTVRKEFEHAGLKVALQMRKNRNGDNPVYAWMAGLATVVCDPENAFEWFGVLREVFGVSDALLAVEFREKAGFHWDDPGVHAGPLREALETLRPSVLAVHDEGAPLENFVIGLTRACRLQGKADRLDPSGALSGELERLLAEAAALGLEGAGPHAWRDHLLLGLEDGRPAGKPEADAINLLTVHSAKGLEWPVVIPIGLWRRIGRRPEAGLKLITTAEGEPEIYFDSGSLPDETKTAREREQWRELVRLLYVALTRARTHLVLPCGEGFGGSQRVGKSFAELWGRGDLWNALPLLTDAPVAPMTEVESTVEVALATEPPAQPRASISSGATVAGLAQRILPHQLAHKPDWTRSARHESWADEPLPSKDSDEAIEYGLWWHETMEFMPWGASEAAVNAYLQQARRAAAEKGFAVRADHELDLLRKNRAWGELHDRRWTRLAELSVFAPLGENAWIDGVIDLVMHDMATGDLRIIDWKTNRLRAGESAEVALARLKYEYKPQLAAYGESARRFFPGAHVSLWLYSSGVGDWAELSDV